MRRALASASICLLSCSVASRSTAVRGEGRALAPAMDTQREAQCPESCEHLFTSLEDGLDGRGKTQHVEVQIRGEPKSGTGMMQEWAWGGLVYLCLRLKAWYGVSSCETLYDEEPEDAATRGRPHSIVFEPARASGEGVCTCDTVERVQILVSATMKHTLPVDRLTCGWWHLRGVMKPEYNACITLDGHPSQNLYELWDCLADYDCPISDDRLQLAVMRDPRAITVSSYFQLLRQDSEQVNGKDPAMNTVDGFFQAHLPSVSMWTSLRYILFTQLMADRSAVFWYEDAMADPMDWFGRYFAFVSVRLPRDEISNVAQLAASGSILGQPTKGMDKHPGGAEQIKNRTYADELSEESLRYMDDVLRIWLPTVVLNRLGVEPLK